MGERSTSVPDERVLSRLTFEQQHQSREAIIAKYAVLEDEEKKKERNVNSASERVAVMIKQELLKKQGKWRRKLVNDVDRDRMRGVQVVAWVMEIVERKQRGMGLKDGTTKMDVVVDVVRKIANDEDLQADEIVSSYVRTDLVSLIETDMLRPLIRTLVESAKGGWLDTKRIHRDISSWCCAALRCD